MMCRLRADYETHLCCPVCGCVYCCADWSDKQDYINLLRERGVPILDSVDASDSQLASVQFAIGAAITTRMKAHLC